MNPLRNSKVLAVLGALAVMLAVTVIAAPSAEAGYGHTISHSTYYPAVSNHYVSPGYPSCGYYPTYPVYPTYPTYPWYPGCGYPRW